jgi:hypothetical protein
MCGLSASRQSFIDSHFEEVECCVNTMLIQSQLGTNLLDRFSSYKVQLPVSNIIRMPKFHNYGTLKKIVESIFDA